MFRLRNMRQSPSMREDLSKSVIDRRPPSGLTMVLAGFKVNHAFLMHESTASAHYRDTSSRRSRIDISPQRTNRSRYYVSHEYSCGYNIQAQVPMIAWRYYKVPPSSHALWVWVSFVRIVIDIQHCGDEQMLQYVSQRHISRSCETTHLNHSSPSE